MDLKKRLNLGSLMRKRSTQDATSSAHTDTDSPEANAARGVRLFCESAAANSGEEVLHLPIIVESAVASPTAAAAAAQQMRKFLSKDHFDHAHVQYNAVMLIRILADNPGPSFTKNLDKPFADTVKYLLRNGRDASVAQIVRETLDALEREKAYDTNLNILFAMWRKEKGLMANAVKHFGPRTLHAPPWSGQPPPSSQAGFSADRGRSSSRSLPPPAELAGRIEEARTSAKLLLQLVQSTPPHELLSNDLVKEFAERCMSAQRSLQAYIACDNPPPDDDTMLTLIETNEQLSLAASKHQRAVLQARRLVATSPPPQTSPQPPQPTSLPAGVPGASYDPSSLPPRDAGPPEPNAWSTEPSQTPAPHPLNYPNHEPPLPSPPLPHHSPPSPPSSSLWSASNRPNANAVDENPFADPSASSAPGRDAKAGGPVDSPAAGPNHSGLEHPHTGQQASLTKQPNMQDHHRQPPMSEEEEYARDYPANPDLQTSERSRFYQQTNHDVSPIAERNTVTYRY